MGKKAGLGASSAAIDPTLDALFSSSAGPVKAPPKSRYSQAVEKPTKDEGAGQSEDSDDNQDDAGDDEDLSEASDELDYEEDEDADKSSLEEDEKESGDEGEEAQDTAKGSRDTVVTRPEASHTSRERKRKRKDEYDDLEDKYMTKLAQDDSSNRSEKRQKAEAAGESKEEEDDDDKIPQHESLSKDAKPTELEKADRTVFLSNVASEAVSQKSAKRTLLAHLSSCLDQEAGEKVESIRFRSVAFSAGSMPKRAAYITGQLMEATTKSSNAYAVFSTTQGARKAANKLNGTIVLGRHIRVDSVSHPSPTDHRRCVFVGNLGFVDDESVLETTEDGETIKKKRSKVPADIEEGLWRTFGKQGKVESVRVVRDPKTRVGKGIAYVQFYDGNAVESSLLLDGKKFPPMLPRTLRVTRAKDPRKTASAVEREKSRLQIARADGKGTKYKPKLTAEEKSQAGRAGKLLGRAGAAAERRKGQGKDWPGSRQSVLQTDDDVEMKTPEQIVFEGTRASSKNGPPKDLKFGKKGKKPAKGGKPMNRGTRRAAEWRKKKA